MKNVVSGYQDNDGSYVVVLDDGSHLFWNNVEKRWVHMLPPLPPEALGVVAAFEMGDRVTVAGHEGVGSVRQVMIDVEWPECNGRGIFVPGQLTKVPR